MDRMLALMGNRNSTFVGLLGFRFQPTDQEILLFYLHQIVVENQPLPPPLDNVVRRCDLFGHLSEPSVIWTDFGGDKIYDLDGTLYFVTKLKKHGSRVERKVGKGKWSETEPYKDVPRFAHNGNNNRGPDDVIESDHSNNNNPMIGRKRKFRYENDESNGDHCGFMLEELSLFDMADDAEHDQKDRSKNPYDFDFVICRMKRNEREDKTKNEKVQKPANKRKRSPADDQSEEHIINPTSKKQRKDQPKKKIIRPRNRKKGQKDQSKVDSVNIDDSTTATPSEPSELAAGYDDASNSPEMNCVFNSRASVELDGNRFSYSTDESEQPLPADSVGQCANTSDGQELGNASAYFDSNQFFSEQHSIDETVPLPTDSVGLSAGVAVGSESAVGRDETSRPPVNDISYHLALILEDSNPPTMDDIFNSTETVVLDGNQFLSKQHGIDETEPLPADYAGLSANSSDGEELGNANAAGYDESNRPPVIDIGYHLALVLEDNNAPTMDDIFTAVESADQSVQQDGASACYSDDVLNQPSEENSYGYTMHQQLDDENHCWNTPVMDQEVYNEDFYLYTYIDDDYSY